MLRLRFFSLNMENIEVKRSILFQIPYFRKLVVKKLRVFGFCGEENVHIGRLRNRQKIKQLHIKLSCCADFFFFF